MSMSLLFRVFIGGNGGGGGGPFFFKEMNARARVRFLFVWAKFLLPLGFRYVRPRGPRNVTYKNVPKEFSSPKVSSLLVLTFFYFSLLSLSRVALALGVALSLFFFPFFCLFTAHTHNKVW